MATPITPEFLVEKGFRKGESRDKRKSHGFETYHLNIPRHLAITLQMWFARGEGAPFQVTPRISSSAMYGGEPLRVPSDCCCTVEQLTQLCRVFGWDLENSLALRDEEI